MHHIADIADNTVISGADPVWTTRLSFGRQGTGWEVAYATIFLISNEASYINAHVLLVDGGLEWKPVLRQEARAAAPHEEDARRCPKYPISTWTTQPTR